MTCEGLQKSKLATKGVSILRNPNSVQVVNKALLIFVSYKGHKKGAFGGVAIWLFFISLSH